MPQFTRQTARPLTTPSYHRAARRLREMADTIDRTAARQTPQERAALTRAIHVLLDVVRVLRARHDRLAPLPEWCDGSQQE